MEIPPSLLTWPGAVLLGEEAFLQVQPKIPGAQFVVISFCLIPWNYPGELGSIFSCGSLADLLLASSLLGETNPAPSTSARWGKFSGTLTQLPALHWTHLVPLHPSYTGQPKTGHSSPCVALPAPSRSFCKY